MLPLGRYGLIAFSVLWGLVPRVMEAGQQGTHDPRSTVKAMRATAPPSIDGQLSEEAWKQAEPATNFTQVDPDEGQPATERTEVRILYDDRALYIGARMLDREARSI